MLSQHRYQVESEMLLEDKDVGLDFLEPTHTIIEGS